MHDKTSTIDDDKMNFFWIKIFYESCKASAFDTWIVRVLFMLGEKFKRKLLFV